MQEFFCRVPRGCQVQERVLYVRRWQYLQGSVREKSPCSDVDQQPRPRARPRLLTHPEQTHHLTRDSEEMSLSSQIRRRRRIDGRGLQPPQRREISCFHHHQFRIYGCVQRPRPGLGTRTLAPILEPRRGLDPTCGVHLVLQLVLEGVGSRPRDPEGEVGVAFEDEGSGDGGGRGRGRGGDCWSRGVEFLKVTLQILEEVSLHLVLQFEYEVDHRRAISKVDLQAERSAEVFEVVLLLGVLVSASPSYAGVALETTSLDLFSFVFGV